MSMSTDNFFRKINFASGSCIPFHSSHSLTGQIPDSHTSAVVLFFDLHNLLWEALHGAGGPDVSSLISSLVGSRDNLSLINEFKSKPVPFFIPSASLSLEGPSLLLSLSPDIFLKDSCVLLYRFGSKFSSFFMLSIAGSMMSRNPITHEASSTTSVRCETQ